MNLGQAAIKNSIQAAEGIKNKVSPQNNRLPALKEESDEKENITGWNSDHYEDHIANRYWREYQIEHLSDQMFE